MVNARRAVAKDERRAQLLRAAQEVFARRGYHAATVDDITRAAGVAKGTFYLYFQEKREIYVEVIRSFLQLVKDLGREVALAPRGNDFLARCEAAALGLMKVFVEHRQMVKLAYRESMGMDPTLEGLIREFYREMAEVAAQNVRIGIELGVFREVDPMLMAYTQIGMVERVLLATLEEGNQLPPPEIMVREIVAFGFRGLAK